MLRMDSHAQKEIRLYANAMLEITRAVAPRAVESFERNTLSAVRFTGAEMAELKRRLADRTGAGQVANQVSTKGAETAAAATAAGEAPLLKGKELERFNEKLRTGKQL